MPNNAYSINGGNTGGSPMAEQVAVDPSKNAVITGFWWNWWQ